MESVLELCCVLFFAVVMMTTVLAIPFLLLWLLWNAASIAKEPSIRKLLRNRRFGLGSLLGLVAVIAVSLSLVQLLGGEFIWVPDWGVGMPSWLSGLCCLLAFVLPIAFVLVTAVYWVWCDFFESSARRRRRREARSSDPFAPVSQEPTGEQPGSEQPGDPTGASPPEAREGRAEGLAATRHEPRA